MMAVYYWYCV